MILACAQSFNALDQTLQTSNKLLSFVLCADSPFCTDSLSPLVAQIESSFEKSRTLLERGAIDFFSSFLEPFSVAFDKFDAISGFNKVFTNDTALADSRKDHEELFQSFYKPEGKLVFTLGRDLSEKGWALFETLGQSGLALGESEPSLKKASCVFKTISCIIVLWKDLKQGESRESTARLCLKALARLGGEGPAATTMKAMANVIGDFNWAHICAQVRAPKPASDGTR